MKWNNATSAKMHCRCRVVFFRSFISYLVSVLFQVHPYLKWSLQKPFSLVSLLFGGFLNQLPNRKRMHLLCWRRTLLAMETNAFRPEDERVENTLSNFSHAHSYSYKRLPNRPTQMYSPLKTGGFRLFYSPPTPTSYTCTIAFSAGLNGLQVDQVDKENNKQTSTYTQLV